MRIKAHNPRHIKDVDNRISRFETSQDLAILVLFQRRWLVVVDNLKIQFFRTALRLGL
jgi:hypothetical protein